jgi:hypothetical protein
MSPAPHSRWPASLMETAYMMVSNGFRPLDVLKEKKPVGIIRKKNLIFEMEKILRNSFHRD